MGKISALCGTFAFQPLLTVCYGLDMAFDCLSLYSPRHNHYSLNQNGIIFLYMRKLMY